MLQPVPRRFFRYLLVTSRDARVWMGRDVMRIPAAGLVQALFLARARGPRTGVARRRGDGAGDVRRLPGLLDHVDGLLADGTIGGEQPNAADFQILSGVRVLLEFEDLAGWSRAGRARPAARSLFPTWIGPIPRGLPAQLSDGSAGIVAMSR